MKNVKKLILIILCFGIVVGVILPGCEKAGTKTYNSSPILCSMGGKLYVIGISDSFDIIDPRAHYGTYSTFEFNIQNDFVFFGDDNKSVTKPISDLDFTVPSDIDVLDNVDDHKWLYSDESIVLNADISGVPDGYVGVAGGWNYKPRKVDFVSNAEIKADILNAKRADNLKLEKSDDGKKVSFMLTAGSNYFTSSEQFEEEVSDFKIASVVDLNGDGCLEMIITFKTADRDIITIHTLKYGGLIGFVRQARFEFWK